MSVKIIQEVDSWIFSGFVRQIRLVCVYERL